MTAAIAVSMGRSGYIFDVVTAFLTGEKLQPELYTRSPNGGLPAVGSCPSVKPFGLWTILNLAYGLAEVPSLLYLEAKNWLEGIGAVELKIARAVFVFREKNKIGTAGLIPQQWLRQLGVLIYCNGEARPRFWTISLQI